MVITTGPCESDLNRLKLRLIPDSLGYGKDDQVTFTGNYIHHTSGRSPRLEFNSHWHVYNNYW
jgi:pectate lyase